MIPDPFGTQRLRDVVLTAWEAQPARFREDANAEEDHGRGYYRDRVIVELAQNAADAAARAQVPGRVLLRLVAHGSGGTLLAANVGAPLDAAGVASLASLRASAKRDDPVGGRTVGRFGVGFAAVRSVADEITVASTTGAVHFSLHRSAEELADVGPELTAEVDRRQGMLPVLRLPFDGFGPGADPAVAGDGWDTVVVLDLRDAAAVAEVRRQLAAVGDPLLLALPALGAIEVDDDGAQRVVTDVASRWVVATRTGVHPEALLADRPVEERDRRGWQVTWAVPRRPGREQQGVTGLLGAPTEPGGARTVHAPTPTDEPCTLPALLLGTFPLDPSRRHVAAGPLTDALVEHAGTTWADLLIACRDLRATNGTDGTDRTGEAAHDPTDGADVPDPLDLLPPSLPAGALDAALRVAAVEASRDVQLLTPVAGGPPITGPEAVVLTGPAGRDRAALAGLARWMPHVVDLAPRHRHLISLLGCSTTDLSEVVDALPHTSPAEHRALYDAFAAADTATLEELATLPVPLADGRTVRGARGLVLLDDRLGDVPDGPSVGLSTGLPTVLSGWGIRAVHPSAAHPLLVRLGATRTGAVALLHHPAVRERVLDDADDEPGRVTEVVLQLFRAALDEGVTLTPEPWWGEVLLPAQDGELVPARGLVAPGSPAARWYDRRILPVVEADAADRWREVLPALGVRTGLTVLPVDLAAAAAGAGEGADTPDGRVEDIHLVTESLDGWDDYLDALADGGADLERVGEVTVIADLDAVLPERWPEVLRAMSEGAARRALTEPVRGAGGELPSYTAWWLRRRSPLGLDRPFAAVLDGARRGRPALGGLLGPMPAALEGLDRVVLLALGGASDLRDLDAEGWSDLLDALPDVPEAVAVPLAVEVWQGLTALAQRTRGGRTDELPDADAFDADRVPALVARGRVAMVPIDRVAVATPMWAQRPAVHPVVVAGARTAEALAELLDVELADERAAGRVTSTGHEVATPPEVLEVFAEAPPTWWEHDDLLVDGEQVDWWVEDGGAGAAVVHAATTAGLARGLASVVGWSSRWGVERLLSDPGSVDEVALDRAGDGPEAQAG